MKTGIVTFHSAHNFGASFQTWALQKSLKNLGADPVVINYRPEIIDSLYDPLFERRGLKRAAKKVLAGLKKDGAMSRFRKYENFIAEHFPLLGEYHTYEELEQGDFSLDACIVGSDQVWNIQHTGGDPAYLLEFLPENVRKISYGASVGTDYLVPSCRKSFERGLRDFSHISVREESARTLIQEITDKPVEVVLDPTLLLKKEDYEELKTAVPHKEKYILVYMMEKNPEVIRFANYISRLLGLPVVQRRPNKFFDNELESCYTATPGEFLDYVEQAELVITNSFHGTVFSIIYEKPFLAMLHSDTGSRTTDLLRALRLEEHLLREDETRPDFSRFMLKEKEQTRALIEEKRRHSLDFLKTALWGE